MVPNKRKQASRISVDSECLFLDDTLLYGVEVKFYNMEVDIDKNLETIHKGLYVIGDGSGVTHSLSHASASGVYVARHIVEGMMPARSCLGI